jgi:hypothetical protein
VALKHGQQTKPERGKKISEKRKMKREEKKTFSKNILWQITKFYSAFPYSFLPETSSCNNEQFELGNCKYFET